MTCPQTSSIYSFTFYENREVSFRYDGTGAIDIVNHEGQEITIDVVNRAYYTDDKSMGDNFKLMHNHKVTWLAFGLDEAMQQIATLSNAYGWIVAITFNDQSKYIIRTPLLLQEDSELDARNTHTFELSLQSRVDTYEGLSEFVPTDPVGIGVMIIETDFIIA